jgi:hypothetical protein
MDLVFVLPRLSTIDGGYDHWILVPTLFHHHLLEITLQSEVTDHGLCTCFNFFGATGFYN